MRTSNWKTLLAAVVLCGAAAAAQPLDAESDAWTAATTMKETASKQRSGYVAAAAAFDSFAKAYPESAKAHEAWIESATCWVSQGYSLQKLQRNTPEGVEALTKASEAFHRFVEQFPGDALAGRAQYMRGTTFAILGELEKAEKEYGVVLDRYRKDDVYYARALERRATVRRHLLRYDLAREDLDRYQKEIPKGGKNAESIERQIKLSAMIGMAAPALQAEGWVQGDPVELKALEGEVVGVYFFASWCPVCAREREFMNDLVERYSGSGLRIIGIVDHSQNQTVASVQSHLAFNPVLYPVMMDAALPKSAGKTTSAYRGSKVPDLLLIDRRGKIRWRDSPELLNDSTIEALLFEK
jgi:tetratricopeptide (TPR) repeat protein